MQATSSARGIAESSWRVQSIVLWCCLGLLTLLTGRPDAPDLNHLGIALLALMFGVWVFWIHGRNQVTAGGLYSLASAIFVGYAGIWWWQQDAPVSPELFVATQVGFWTNLGMYALIWRHKDPTPVEQKDVPVATSQLGLLLGVVVAGLSFAFWFLLGPGNELVTSAGFAGLSLLVVSLVVHRAKRPRPLRRLLVGGAMVALYSQTLFSGYGRLILVSLALVPVVLVAGQVSDRRVKTALIAGIAPAIVLLSIMRERFGVSTYGEALNGIGSVVEPLRDFGRLPSALQNGGFSYGLGDTFWATATFFIPRSLWEEKPIGFGAVLTQIFAPSMASFGQSFAALVHGEWFYNFGWLGVALMLPCLGLLIRLLDDILDRTRSATVESIPRLLYLVMVLMAVADIPNLLWGGTFAYVSRTGFRLAVLFLIIALWRILFPDADRLREAAPAQRLGRERRIRIYPRRASL